MTWNYKHNRMFLLPDYFPVVSNLQREVTLQHDNNFATNKFIRRSTEINLRVFRCVFRASRLVCRDEIINGRFGSP